MTETKNVNFEKLIRPNTFFCTFQEEAAFQKMISLKKVVMYGIELECE